MCNYIYKLNIEKSCPYLKKFKNNLPIDKTGLCIFHSEDIEWKRNNDFFHYFLQIFILTNDSEYDFCEFKLIGTKGAKGYTFNLSEHEYLKTLNFKGAIFLDKFELNKIIFHDGANFENVIFEEDMIIKNSTFSTGVIFDNSIFKKTNTFSKINFNSYALFENVKFLGNTNSYFSKFINSKFLGMTDFSNSIFSSPNKNATIGFINIEFQDFTNFSDTSFHNRIVFENTSFEDITNFIYTSFNTTKTAIAYMESSINFKDIEIKKNANLIFKSTDLQKPLFQEETNISFKKEILGIIEFENIDFTKFTKLTYIELLKQEKLGKVIIGNKCIKYRHQTQLKELSVANDNTPLILELCNTFSNYFTVNNGFNLGFEIVERTKNKIYFFYYTDENISQEIFLKKLEKTEKDLWYLLFPQLDNKKLIQDNQIISTSTIEESTVINTIDGISALMSTFFRVSIRIAFGKWKEEDTKSLINAISTNKELVVNPSFLHQTIIHNYNQKVLFGINNQQYQIQS